MATWPAPPALSPSAVLIPRAWPGVKGGSYEPQGGPQPRPVLRELGGPPRPSPGLWTWVLGAHAEAQPRRPSGAPNSLCLTPQKAITAHLAAKSSPQHSLGPPKSTLELFLLGARGCVSRGCASYGNRCFLPSPASRNREPCWGLASRPALSSPLLRPGPPLQWPSPPWGPGSLFMTKTVM